MECSTFIQGGADEMNACPPSSIDRRNRGEYPTVHHDHRAGAHTFSACLVVITLRALFTPKSNAHPAPITRWRSHKDEARGRAAALGPLIRRAWICQALRRLCRCCPGFLAAHIHIHIHIHPHPHPHPHPHTKTVYASYVHDMLIDSRQPRHHPSLWPCPLDPQPAPSPSTDGA